MKSMKYVALAAVVAAGASAFAESAVWQKVDPFYWDGHWDSTAHWNNGVIPGSEGNETVKPFFDGCTATIDLNNKVFTFDDVAATNTKSFVTLQNGGFKTLNLDNTENFFYTQGNNGTDAGTTFKNITLEGEGRIRNGNATGENGTKKNTTFIGCDFADARLDLSGTSHSTFAFKDEPTKIGELFLTAKWVDVENTMDQLISVVNTTVSFASMDVDSSTGAADFGGAVKIALGANNTPDTPVLTIESAKKTFKLAGPFTVEVGEAAKGDWQIVQGPYASSFTTSENRKVTRNGEELVIGEEGDGADAKYETITKDGISTLVLHLFKGAEPKPVGDKFAAKVQPLEDAKAELVSFTASWEDQTVEVKDGMSFAMDMDYTFETTWTIEEGFVPVMPEGATCDYDFEGAPTLKMTIADANIKAEINKGVFTFFGPETQEKPSEDLPEFMEGADDEAKAAYAAWAAKFVVAPTDAKVEAFLLDCANDDAEIEKAEKDFVIDSIKQAPDGTWVVTVKNDDGGSVYEGGKFRNGRVSIVASEKFEQEKGKAEFFKAILEVPKAE